jgi:hypothetical protein
MKPATTNPLHNPFYNRFNDPVTRRQDTMQAEADMVWLRERDRGICPALCNVESGPSSVTVPDQTADVAKASEPELAGRIFKVFTLFFVLLLSLAVLLKLF